jgi:hypothetical protein
METPTSVWNRPRFWIVLIGLVILLIALYFYKPFETYLVEGVPKIRFDNIVFWFASLVGVVAFAIAHWQSYKRNIFQDSGAVQVDNLIFETLQITLLTAVIFGGGATLQAVVVLSEHLMRREPVANSSFGEQLLAIVILVIVTLLFYLLHLAVRAIRGGWSARTHPARRSGPGPTAT